MIIDLYTAVMLEATGNPNIPTPGFNNLKVFVPQWQRIKIKKSGNFKLIDRMRDHRLYPEELAELAPELVVVFRSSLSRDLERAACLNNTSAVWSMWSGYVKGDFPFGTGFIDFCKRNSIPWKVIHSSGHAPKELLDKIINRIDAKNTVIVHTLKDQTAHPD